MRLSVYGFVLLFIVNSAGSYAQEETLKLYLPKPGEKNDGEKPANPVWLFTLILDEQNKIVHYSGEFKRGVASGRTDYKKVRELIQKKKKEIGDSIIVIIKPGAGATYKNTVDILDEMSINDIKRYALLDITRPEEAEFGLTPGAEKPQLLKAPETEKKPIDYSSKDVLLIRLNSRGAIEYGYGKLNEINLTRLPEADSTRFGGIIRELVKGKSDVMVFIKGDPDAKYPTFKTIMTALKENELYKFELITEKD